MATAPATLSTTLVEEIGKDQNDGLMVGKDSSALVGFFGTSPVAAQSTPTAPATTVAISTGTIWGFASSTQANAIQTALNTVITALETYGLLV
jgi:hypothetical protein